MKTLGIVVIAGCLLCGGALALTDEPVRELPPPAQPDASTLLRRALGRELFWSSLLSNNAAPLSDRGPRVRCGSCHLPEKGGAAGAAAVDVEGKKTFYNVPTVFNAAHNMRQTWGGSETTLEDVSNRALSRLMGSAAQAGKPDALMENLSPRDSLVVEEGRALSYLERFERAYAGTALLPVRRVVPRAALLDALAEYMRSITPRDSRFDVWMANEQSPALFSDEERAGYALFKRLGCSSCHQGANVGGNMLALFGVLKRTNSRDEELGLETDPLVAPTRNGEGSGLARDTRATPMFEGGDDGIYKVPSLRNVALTAPYFHDGGAESLEVAVRIMAWKQLGRTLSDGETRELVAFLNTLTGTVPASATPPEGAE